MKTCFVTHFTVSEDDFVNEDENKVYISLKVIVKELSKDHIYLIFFLIYSNFKALR